MFHEINQLFLDTSMAMETHYIMDISHIPIKFDFFYRCSYIQRNPPSIPMFHVAYWIVELSAVCGLHRPIPHLGLRSMAASISVTTLWARLRTAMEGSLPSLLPRFKACKQGVLRVKLVFLWCFGGIIYWCWNGVWGFFNGVFMGV